MNDKTKPKAKNKTVSVTLTENEHASMMNAIEESNTGGPSVMSPVSLAKWALMQEVDRINEGAKAA